MCDEFEGGENMDTPARKALEERVEREARDLLQGGDQAYLSGLSRAGLLEALETELRFLGLYAHEEQEIPVMIRDILRQKLDAWRQSPAAEVRISESPWIVKFSGASVGLLRSETNHRFNFTQLASIRTDTHNSEKAGDTYYHNFAHMEQAL
jgi:hypothetical protein